MSKFYSTADFQETIMERAAKRRRIYLHTLNLYVENLCNVELHDILKSIQRYDGKRLKVCARMAQNWDSPFSRLPPELLSMILCNAFDNVTRASQLMRVCTDWYTVLKDESFWKLWLCRHGYNLVGFHFLCKNVGLRAALLCKTRSLRYIHSGYSYKVMGITSTLGFHSQSCEGIGVNLYNRDNRVTYKGNFLRGFYHGLGKSYNSNGAVTYIGLWSNGQPNGYGVVYQAAEGYVISQRRQSRKLNGIAIYYRYNPKTKAVCLDDDIVQLTFVKGRVNGHAELTLANGYSVSLALNQRFQIKKGPIKVRYACGDVVEAYYEKCRLRDICYTAASDRRPYVQSLNNVLDPFIEKNRFSLKEVVQYIRDIVKASRYPCGLA